MDQSRNSIYDVAKSAGVSPGTVSRVLSGKAHFSKDTRDLVMDAVRKLNFRPRITARKRTIAIVTDKARYATFGGFLSSLHVHLTEEMARTDVAIQLFTEANLDRLDSRSVDSILSISWDNNTLRQLSKIQKDSGTPVLVLNRSNFSDFSSVESDYEGAGRMVADHLLERGHSSIGYIIEDRTPGAMRRLDGIKARLLESDRYFDEDLVALTRHSRTEDAVRQIMRQSPTALFIGSEDLVLEVLSIVRDTLEINIPGDLSVVAMENIHVNRFTNPAITSVRQPLERMAAEAMDVLTKLTETEPDAAPLHRVLENEWIERLSVASAKETLAATAA